MTNRLLRASLLMVLILNIGATNLYSKSCKLPKVVIVATGGTIAGSALAEAKGDSKRALEIFDLMK